MINYREHSSDFNIQNQKACWRYDFTIEQWSVVIAIEKEDAADKYAQLTRSATKWAIGYRNQ